MSRFVERGRSVFTRAIGDSYFWFKRHLTWEVALVVTGAIAGGVVAFFRGDPLRPWEIIGYSVASGLLSIGSLWCAVFVCYLLRAPRVLRDRWLNRIRQPRAHGRLEIRGPRTRLGAEAMNSIIKPLQRLAEKRGKLSGLGPVNEGVVIAEYREALMAIEGFGQRIVSSDWQDTTPEERRRAYRLYEELRGFPANADIRALIDETWTFVVPPDGPLLRLKKRLRGWFRKQWAQVT